MTASQIAAQNLAAGFRRWAAKATDEAKRANFLALAAYWEARA